MGNFRKDLSAQQREELKRIIGDNNSMFVEELRIGEPIPGVEYIIELSTDQPIAIPVRQYSLKKSSLIKQAVEELKKLKILQASKSPYCARALVVPKHDGTPRLVIDYQSLNKVTKKDKFPLPIIKDTLRRMGDAIFFTTMDLASGFCNIFPLSLSNPITASLISHFHLVEILSSPWFQSLSLK